MKNTQTPHVRAGGGRDTRQTPRAPLPNSTDPNFLPERGNGTEPTTGITAGNRITHIEPPSSNLALHLLCFKHWIISIELFEISSNALRHKPKRRSLTQTRSHGELQSSQNEISSISTIIEPNENHFIFGITNHHASNPPTDGDLNRHTTLHHPKIEAFHQTENPRFDYNQSKNIEPPKADKPPPKEQM